MLHDLSLAIKHLRRSPLFVVVAVVTLGLGIGLTSTMLTMLDAVVHPYVPYRDVEHLYSVDAYGTGGSGQVTAYDKYQVLVENSKSFQDIAGAAWGGRVLAEAYGNAMQVQMTRVTGNYFPLLGMKPEAGRFFVAGPSGPDEGRAVVSHYLWARFLDNRPLDQGVSITVDGRDYAVIGVMPPEAGWPLTEIIVRTAGFGGDTPEQRRSLFPIARLKAGVSEEGAYAELNIIAGRLAAAYGEGQQGFSFRLRSWKARTRPDAITDFQFAMAGAAVSILLIVCANLANLMLARGLNRRPEMALRLALGAGRRDLIRQLLTEGSIVGLLGGAVGTILAVWGVDVVRHRLPLDGRWIGYLMPHLDWRVFAFALGTTFVSVVAFGLGPALTASDVSVTEPLKEAGTTTTGRNRRRYSFLVIAEVGICLVLLMGAALMLRRLDAYNTFDPGYETKGLLTGNVNLMRLKVPDSLVARSFNDLRDRLHKTPGVLEVAMSGGGRTQQGAITSDLEGPEPRFIVALGYQTVSPEYVRVMGYRVFRGRDLSIADLHGPPVALVDETMGDRLWPGLDPVGRMIKLGGPSSRAPWVRVVGLLRSRRMVTGDGQERLPGLLLVLSPRDASRNREVLARISGNDAVVGMAMRRKVVDMFPVGQWNGGFFSDRDRSHRESLQSFSFITRLFMSLGGLGLVLAAVGMYGVLAYAVAQRMREFGIRIALGAETQSVFRLVLHDAAVMILAGTAIGAWFAMWAGTLMVDEGAMIPPTDWIALVASEAVLLLVCFGACLTPAIRASKANPLDIIRAI